MHNFQCSRVSDRFPRKTLSEWNEGMKRATGGDRTETKTCETIPSYPSGNVILFWTGSDSFKLFFRGFPLHFEPRPVVSLCDSRAQRRMLTGYPCQRQAQNMEPLPPEQESSELVCSFLYPPAPRRLPISAFDRFRRISMVPVVSKTVVNFLRNKSS